MIKVHPNLSFPPLGITSSWNQLIGSNISTAFTVFIIAQYLLCYTGFPHFMQFKLKVFGNSHSTSAKQYKESKIFLSDSCLN